MTQNQMQPMLQSVMSKTETEVLIVGAGPTGLTTACELQRWGNRN